MFKSAKRKPAPHLLALLYFQDLEHAAQRKVLRERAHGRRFSGRAAGGAHDDALFLLGHGGEALRAKRVQAAQDPRRVGAGVHPRRTDRARRELALHLRQQRLVRRRGRHHSDFCGHRLAVLQLFVPNQKVTNLTLVEV